MNWNDLYKIICQRVELACTEGVIPGCVIGVRHQGESKTWAFGDNSYSKELFDQRWDANPPRSDLACPNFQDSAKFKKQSDHLKTKVFTDTILRKLQISDIYDCASVTKSVPLAILALLAIQEKLISLDTLVIDVAPHFGQNYQDVTIWHLLTHTLDFRMSLGQIAKGGEDVIAAIMNRSFDAAPGDIYCYSNSSSIVLAVVLETIYQRPLDELAQDKVFNPLQMTSSTLGVNSKALPVEYCPWRQAVVQGQVHDESAASIFPRNLGAAGLFSNVPDLMKFLEELSLSFQGKGKILTASTIQLLLENQIPLISTTSLGMEFQEPRFMSNKACQEKTLGKTGFTGSHWIFAPEQDLGLVCLSQYTWPRRMSSTDTINQLRIDLSEILFQVS